MLPTVVYDGASQRVLLFGGMRTDGAEVYGDTWTRGAADWAPSNQVGPSPRIGAVAVFDPVRKNVILFGGQTGAHELMSDTWIWNGRAWTQQNPDVFPHWLFPLAGNLAFDGASQEAILFGNTGTSPNPAQGPATFTWAWTGAHWVQKEPAISPPFRFGATMAFDGGTKNVVLYVGYQFEGPGGELGDTWIWDGAAWTKDASSASPAPMPGGNAYAAYDEQNGGLWLLTWDGAMWLWSGNTWVAHGTYASVAHRGAAAMVFDGAIGKIVLYGGKVASQVTGSQDWTETMRDDLWAWDGSSWSQIG